MREYTMFQSTPVIANGRIVVSMDVMPTFYLFQSTPVIANGRIATFLVASSIPPLFQSTPVIANGRIHSKIFFQPSAIFVSIHARYC